MVVVNPCSAPAAVPNSRGGGERPEPPQPFLLIAAERKRLALPAGDERSGDDAGGRQNRTDGQIDAGGQNDECHADCEHAENGNFGEGC